jgi:microcystin-dependent protein
MDAFTGEIRAVGFNYPPIDWMFCWGQTLQISQYPALAAVLGNKFGGDGRTTFALPNLAGRVIALQGQSGPGGPVRAFGSTYGSEQVVLQPGQMPSHSHTAVAAVCSPASELKTPGSTEYLGHSAASGALTYAPPSPQASTLAPQALSQTGQGAAHENRQPYLVLNYIICVNGVFPLRP